jgi:purine-binding chemotaxis protein CheW
MRDEQYVGFKVDGHLFGINILTVREIIRNVDFTPVELAPPAVRGLLNLRGQIITVLDPGPSLGLPLRQITGETRCIIVKTDGELAQLVAEGLLDESTSSEAVGLVVDGISDVVQAGENDLEPAPANVPGIDSRGLRGVVKLDAALLMVLRLDAMIEESVQGQTAEHRA